MLLLKKLCPYTLQFISDNHKTQKMYKKAVSKYSYMLKYCPCKYITKKCVISIPDDCLQILSLFLIVLPHLKCLVILIIISSLMIQILIIIMITVLMMMMMMMLMITQIISITFSLINGSIDDSIDDDDDDSDYINNF